jgi:TrpR-related protein YerC/YecD
VSGDLEFAFAVLSQVRNTEELGRLLEDWLTFREQEELMLRLNIARRLFLGQTYETIETETGASSTTISRVRRALYRGAEGYRTVFERLAAAGRLGPPAGEDPAVAETPGAADR